MVSNRRMAIEKLKINYKTQLKIKPRPIHKLRTIKGAMNSDWSTTDMTQKFRTYVFKFLTLSVEKTVHLHMFKCVYKPSNINVVFSHCGSQQHGSTSHHKWQWRVLRGAVYPMQWMKLMMVCCVMAVMRMGMLGVSARKMKALTEKGRQLHWLVKVDRIRHALCIKCMQLIEKQNFLAHILFVGFILDLDKYIFLWQTCIFAESS